MHFVQALKLDTATLGGIQALAVNPGIEPFLVQADSKPSAQMAGIDTQKPMLPFMSAHIGVLNTLFGIDGYHVNTKPLEAYTVLGAQGAGRAATGEKINITEAIVVPRTLSAAIRPPATISYDVAMCEADGTVPFSVTSGQTVPTPTVSEAFRAGDVTVAASSVGPITSWSIDFGIQLVYDIDPATGFPKMVSIQRHNPRISIETKKPGALVQLGVSGTDDVVSLTLLKAAHGAAFAGSGDLTLACTKNFVYVEELGGQDGDDGAITRINVICVWDGTNAPITVS